MDEFEDQHLFSGTTDADADADADAAEKLTFVGDAFYLSFAFGDPYH